MPGYDNGVTVPGPGQEPAPVRAPAAENLVVPQGTVTAVAGKIPFWGRIKDFGYTYVLGQWAIGFWSAIYVLVTQAFWFGASFAYTWNHLNLIGHFRSVPGIGGWLSANYGIFRHIFLRDAPEAILAYAVVAMIIPKIAGFNVATRKRDRTPLPDRIAVRLRMPSPYQGQLGRHPDTSPLQYVLLIPSMLLAALPGEILASAVIFGGMVLATRSGYHSPWLRPASPWVPIAVGLAGGKFAGHKPAVKAGADLQRFFLGKRLALRYAADKILTAYKTGEINEARAANLLTSMRRTDPSLWYPEVYRRRYESMLAERKPVKHYSILSAFALVVFVTVFVVLGGWGVYLRKYGISHRFWIPRIPWWVKY